MAEENKKHGVLHEAIMQTEIPDDVADGVYANVVSVVFSPAEFVLDFGRVVPGKNNVKVKSRVILSPINAKHLLHNLMEQVRRYEQQFGEIKIPQRFAPETPPGFKQ